MKAGEYPSFFMGSAIVFVSTATSADTEPDIPEKNILKIVNTWANPPFMCPTKACERLTILRMILEDVINSPTSKKNGIAIKASESIPLNI